MGTQQHILATGKISPPQAVKLRRSRRGGLFFLSLFMGLAGMMRLGAGIGTALANTDPSPVEIPAVAPMVCEPDAGAQAMLDALKEREKRLIEQENKAAEQEQSLALARQQIDGKMADLEAVEKKLAATIAQADQASEKDVSQLVAMYEAMKPKDAARLFSEMEPEFAAGFLARMRPEPAAAVLSGLDPSKAYAFSVILAGRNALAPKS